VVQPSDALFVVSDLSSVWAVADVPEQDIAQVQPGQRVEIEVPALDAGLIEGKIVYIADVVNPETRTVRVGVDLPNQNRQLKPQMLINMRIEARRSKRQLVPAAAVVRESDGDHVFVLGEGDRATLTSVRLAPERAGMRPLVDRLPEGTRIVVDGAFHLNNERQRRNLEGSGDAVAQAGPKAGK
jgi:cobalt-zinc-cadmium efflux system membrane fusion protein